MFSDTENNNWLFKNWKLYIWILTWCANGSKDSLCFATNPHMKTEFKTEKSILKLTGFREYEEGPVNIHHQLPLFRYPHHRFQNSKVRSIFCLLLLQLVFLTKNKSIFFNLSQYTWLFRYCYDVLYNMLFHSILYTVNDLTQKLGWGAELMNNPTTVLAEILSTLYEPVMRNKAQLIINVLLVSWHQECISRMMNLTQLHGNSRE